MRRVAVTDDAGPRPAGRRVAASVELDVPADHAFAFLADPATARVIDPAVREYRPDRTPMGPGTTVTIRMRVWGVPVRAASVVRVWEPGRRMVMASVRPSRPVTVVATHLFAPLGADRCRYRWEIEVRPVGRWGVLPARLLARFLGANAAAQNARLKREVERPGRTTSGAGDA